MFGGKAVLCAINKRITIESKLVKSPTIKIISDLGTVEISKYASIKKIKPVFRPIFYIAQKTLREFDSESGLKISITSEFPSGVGLGSSSACCVAAVSSISGLFTRYSKKKILQFAIEAEKTVFSGTSGADSTICTYGGVIEYKKNGTIKKINLKSRLQLLVINSKIIHSTSRVVSKVRQFKDQNQRVFSVLYKSESELIEDALKSLKKKNLKNLGRKMLKNQEYLDTIGVSNKNLNLILETVSERAFGAKITGAGDGGCVIALVDRTNKNSVINALQSHGYEYFLTQIDTCGVKQRTIDE